MDEGLLAFRRVQCSLKKCFENCELSTIKSLATHAVCYGHMDAIRNGFNGNLHISFNIGALTGGSHYNVGLAIGENTLLFHPGLPGGGFRVAGARWLFKREYGFYAVCKCITSYKS